MRILKICPLDGGDVNIEPKVESSKIGDSYFNLFQIELQFAPFILKKIYEKSNCCVFTIYYLCRCSLFLIRKLSHKMKLLQAEVSAPYPTIINLAIEWKIQGDDNQNGIVNLKFREKGTMAWHGRDAVAKDSGRRQ